MFLTGHTYRSGAPTGGHVAPGAVRRLPCACRVRSAAKVLLHMVLELFQSLQNDPCSFFFQGVNAPVRQEVYCQDLEVVQGAVPPELNGIYVRTGPNAQHAPKGGYVMYVSLSSSRNSAESTLMYLHAVFAYAPARVCVRVCRRLCVFLRCAHC